MYYIHKDMKYICHKYKITLQIKIKIHIKIINNTITKSNEYIIYS